MRIAHLSDPHLTSGPLGGEPAGLLSLALRRAAALDPPPATLLVLDSKVEASAAGRLGGDQLRWLETQLGGPATVPTLICLHHPPVTVGIPALDAIRLTDAVELEAALTRHVPPARILAGHVHRAVSASFAGSVVSVAPSTYRQASRRRRRWSAAGRC